MSNTEPEPSYENYKMVVSTVIAEHFTCTEYDNAGVYDLEDLRQEGDLALITALKTYDPNRKGASFFMYAYASIFKSISRYSQKNSSALTVARTSDVVWKGSETVKARYKAALRVFFPGDSLNEKLASIVSGEKEQCEELDTLDLVQHCLEKLHGQLTPAEFGLLALWACGASYREIGSVVEKSKKSARRTVRMLLVKAAGILKEEVYL